MVSLSTRWAPAWLAVCLTTSLAASDTPPPSAIELTPLRAPDWAFPGAGAPGQSSSPSAAGEVLTLPNSSAHFTRAQVQDPFAPPDWRPALHTPMPAIVGQGRKPKVYACGYCHLPDGSGRPENCSLSGLPAAYLEQQIAAFRGGSRDCAVGDSYAPAKAMRALCADLAATDAAEAAVYFSRQHPDPKLTVREVERLTAPRAYRYIYALGPGAEEPIAGRIIETTEDLEGHERRDPATAYTAYVPSGAIARGRRLATIGPAGAATSCFACHGTDLKGTPTAPPLAGHFASYVFRQLLAFRNGSRHDPLAMTMRPVVANLTMADMVDLAAFAAAQPR